MNQQQASTTPKEVRDQWETPDWLFSWLNARFNFDLDLACTFDNAKVGGAKQGSVYEGFAYPNIDMLNTKWRTIGIFGFCNPPYSNIKPWLAKGYEEAKKGFTSVFVVPTPNGEKAYQDYVFGKASEIIFINGRVGFCRPDGTEVKGNTRGTCVIVYDPNHLHNTVLRWADRDQLIKEYQNV